MESPQVINYLLPFIASFGYLFVLGYLGITWIPRIIQKHVLPRFAQDKQEKVAFALMFFFLAAYMPILNYSGASYLTGAFLAGLSFSQIHFVHIAYERSGREIMVWLMRVFFAATIGFQVPIRNFADVGVLKWGLAFCKLMFLICMNAIGHMSYLCLLFPL
jgi:Kef-type K+ transport system membrane component KefB